MNNSPGPAAPTAPTRFDRVLRLGHAVRLVFRAAPGWTTASFFIVTLGTVLPLISLWVTKLVVDSISAGVSNPDKKAVISHLVMLVAVWGALQILTAATRSLESLIREAQSQLVADYMQGIVHEKSVELDLEYYENPAYHDTLARAQAEAMFRPTRIVGDLVQFVQGGIALAGVAGILVAMHPAIAGFLLIIALPLGIVRVVHSRRMYQWQKVRTSLEREASYLNMVLTTEPNAKELRQYGLGDILRARFGAVRRRLRDERLRLVGKRAIWDLLAQSVSALAALGLFGFIALRAIRGAMSLGDLFLSYQAFQRAQSAIQELLASVAGLYEDSLFLSYLHDFLSLQPRTAPNPNALPVPTPLVHGITLEDVSFTYPGRDEPALSGVSLHLKPGQIVALVGPNGCGKSTLMKLLCRLYDPTAGRILWDGIDVRDMDIAEVRARFSVLFQDFVHYFVSARENIWFGDVRKPTDDDGIRSAARQSGADAALAALPHGYDTLLGRYFDGGAEMSQGQWQRVALARAFFGDPNVVILDEPTSALDPVAEGDIVRAVSERTGNHITLVISHRLSTIRKADCIYVLNEGRVVESGRHVELIERGGLYAMMYDAQSDGYVRSVDTPQIGATYPLPVESPSAS